LTGEAVAVLERQMRGDDAVAAASAAREILAKSIAAAKSPGTRIDLPELKDAPTLSAKTAVVDAAVSDGRLTVEQAKTLLAALRDSAEIADLEQASAVMKLVRRGIPLAEALEQIDRHGPAIADAQLAKVISIVPHSN
jgi:hypothetical protein